MSLFVLASLLGVLAWLSTREAALSWVAGFIEAQSGGVLRFEGTTGSLYGPLRIARFTFETPAVRIELVDLEIDWSPKDLLRHHVRIRVARAESATIYRKSGAPPERQPARAIRLPVSIEVETAELGRLDVVLAQHYVFKELTARMQMPREQNASFLAFDASSNRNALTLAGRLDFSATRTFAVTGNLTHLDLARLGTALPRSDVAGQFSAEGALEPKWRARFALKLADSRINDYPLAGAVRLVADNERIHDVDANVSLGSNRATARGAFGSKEDRLMWKVDAVALDQLGPGFAGELRSSGILRGTLAQPAVTFSLDASNVALLGRHLLKRAQGRVELGAGAQNRFVADLSIEGYSLGRFEIDRASARANGTRVRHDLDLRLRNRYLNVQALARGGFEEHGWRGKLSSLSNAGEYETRLQEAADVVVGKNRFVLSNAKLSAGPGAITILLLQKEGETLRTRGEARGIALSYLQSFAATRWPVKPSLTLSADWDLTAADHLDGELRITRETGDVVLDTLPPQALGLTTLKAQIRLVRDAVEGEAVVSGALPGNIAVRARTVLTHAEGMWGIAASAPVSLVASADVSSLAWLGVFTRDKLAFGGRLTIDAKADGTFGAPHWQGGAHAQDLALRIPDQGVDLGKGSLEAKFQEERLIVERLRLQAGEGWIEAGGYLDILGSSAAFDVNAEKLRVIHTPLREVVLGAKGKILLHEKRLDINGQVAIDRARIEIPERAAPTLSEDIVVVGQEEATGTRRRKLPVVPVLDVFVDLGEKFYVKASGLDARLAGNVRVRGSEGGLPQASGTIRIAEGKYSAYGQSLAVERGLLTFTGPIDNPGLDIFAGRKIPAAQVNRSGTPLPPLPTTQATTGTQSITSDQSVQVGVAVTGTAQAPVARLVSTPDMPDGEKLSWLVLGHGLERASGTEIDLLGTAAAALLERGESVSLQSQIAQRAGLDEFRLKGGGGLQGAIVTLGKQLSSDVYVSYERSVAGTTNLMRIRYALTPAWSVQTETGSSETGGKGTAVDLFYTFSFH